MPDFSAVVVMRSIVSTILKQKSVAQEIDVHRDQAG
jgi:hypothetical protein